MKYIEPPTRKKPKYVPPPEPPKDNFWIRVILGAGTIALLLVLSQLFK